MDTGLHHQQPILAHASPTNASRGYMVAATTAIIASGRPLSAAVSDICTRDRSTGTSGATRPARLRPLRGRRKVVL